MLRPQVDAKGLQLRLDWPDDLPNAVIGDPTRFSQIVTNLVGNALKFTAAGSVTLRARVAAEDGPTLRLHFEVEDTGIGIAPDALPRLFQSFTQSDSSITRKYGGTGLGLAIVRRLCELMGGECGVRSEFGRGSSFWFTLAMRRDLQDRSAQATGVFQVLRPRRTGAGGSPGLHVLLVEDNLINQEVTLGLLELLGTRATRRRQRPPRTRDADRATRIRPRADGLPDAGDGRPRGDPAHPRPRGRVGAHVPIMALTANAMVGDREQCLEAGMDDFLSKPFQLRELAAAINRWCPQSPLSATDSPKEMSA